VNRQRQLTGRSTSGLFNNLPENVGVSVSSFTIFNHLKLESNIKDGPYKVRERSNGAGMDGLAKFLPQMPGVDSSLQMDFHFFE
jgi:ABC-type polar amino acid transport system ATPase subunit